MKINSILITLSFLIITSYLKAQGWKDRQYGLVQFTSLAVINEDDVYLSADILGSSGTIISTTNLGQNWSSLHQLPGSVITGSLCSDGSGNMYFSAFFGADSCQIFRTADNFGSVVPTLSDSLAKSIIDIQFSEGKGYAVGWRCADTACSSQYTALFTYRENSQSWQWSSLPLPNVYGLQLLDSTNLYAWSNTGLIIHSSDQGQSWDSLTAPIQINGSLRAFHMQSDSVAYCATNNNSLFRSNDSANTWLAIPGITARVNKISSRGPFVMLITDFEGRVIYTKDNGIHWNIDTLPSSQQMTDLEISSEGIFISASLGHFYYHDSSIFPNVSESEVQPMAALELYPNPIGDWLVISGAKGPLQVTLNDSRGQVIIKRMLYSGERIDISHLTRGMYFLNCINQQQGVQSFRIVK